MNKPQPQILTIWRITLTVAAIIPALSSSLFLRVGSRAWLLASGGLAAVYLAAYLAYLPLLYKNTSYSVFGGKLILATGVFNTRITALPLSGIQFVSVLRPAVSRMFGLASVIAVAPGGRLAIRGLRNADAESLAFTLGGGKGENR